jgi:zinc protease
MKKVSALLTLVAFLIASQANAQFKLVEKVEGTAEELIIPYTKYELESNQLTLIIHEDHSDPVVHVQVAYHVGSARESVRNSGFAHFFEHMMFQGSKNVADEEHFEIISRAGGTNNAFTSFDKTVYINTAPSNLTETLLWLEADRMGTHLDGFTEKKFNNQRDAVKNEKRQRYDNQPYGMVNEVLFKTMFPNHPYEWTPIGYVDDLDIAEFDDLRNFFLRWYGPNNATLVVSGDVNPEEVKQWVNKYYSTIKPTKYVPKPRANKVLLPSDIYVPTTDNIYLPLTVMAFPTVKEYHPDEAALNVLSRILGRGNNSLLYKKFVKEEIAVQASSSHSSLELAGLFDINVVANFMGLGFPEIEEKIRETLEEFNTQGASQEEVQRAIANIKSNKVDELNSVASKALLLSQWDMMKGNGYNLNQEIARYDEVTIEDVMRVFRKYIYKKNAVILTVARQAPKQGDDEKSKSVNPHAGKPKVIESQYKGLTYTPPKDDFDRSVRPDIPPAKAIELPDYFTATMDNGLKMIGTQSKDMPKVYLYFTMKGGHLLEADKKIRSGTANLTAQLMGEGTKTLTSEEFSAKLQNLGSGISVSSGNYETTIFVESFAENIDATLKLLEDAMFNPRFDEKDFNRIKKQNLQGIRNRKSNPSFLGSSQMNKVMYGGTIREESASGDYKSVDKIKLQDCIDFYNRFYSPNVTSLAIVGPLDQSTMMSKLDFLKSWENKNVSVPVPPGPQKSDETTIYLVDKPYAAQSYVLASFPSNDWDYNGDHFKSTVMNFALGGAFNSRINLNLREDKGYTYGARSYFTANEYGGRYYFSSNIKKEATDSAIVELMKEITNYKESGITEEELEFTKSSILLSKALQYETPFQKLGFLSQIIEYDLPKDYTQQQEDIINALTQEDINKLAAQMLMPNNTTIVVVGHAYKIRASLEKLGYKFVEVK